MHVTMNSTTITKGSLYISYTCWEVSLKLTQVPDELLHDVMNQKQQLIPLCGLDNWGFTVKAVTRIVIDGKGVQCVVSHSTLLEPLHSQSLFTALCSEIVNVRVLTILISCQQSVTISKCGTRKCYIYVTGINLPSVCLSLSLPDRWCDLTFIGEQEKYPLQFQISTSFKKIM